MKRKPFSLIELLITIAVIAILVGVLLPALNHAREKAIDLHCINNLKQFGTAFMTYRADSEDKMPMWSSDLFPSYIPSAQVYVCKRDQNPQNVTYPYNEWRLNVPGTTTGADGSSSDKFVEAYDFPRAAESSRNLQYTYDRAMGDLNDCVSSMQTTLESSVTVSRKDTTGGDLTIGTPA